jgi:hypothetical protein
LGYQRWWEALETLIAEFRLKRLAIPPETMTSLRSAKTLISIYQTDPACLESTPMIEGQLLNVESTLINTAKEKLGSTFADEWLARLDKARREDEPKATKSAWRFVAGLPKDDHWIRVLPSDDLLRADIERLAGEVGLASRIQDDGYLLVFGKEERVREFVQRMAAKCRRPPVHRSRKRATSSTMG